MKNLPVKKKLLLGFMIVAVFAAAVGTAGIYGLVDLDGNGDSMYSIALSLSAANEVETNLHAQGAAFRDALLYMDDPPKRESILKELDAADKELDALAQYIFANVVNEKDLAILRDLQAVYEQEFVLIRGEFVQAVESGQAQIAGDLLPSLDERMDRMSALARDFSEAGKVAIQATNEAGTIASKVLIASMIVLSLLAVGLGIFLGNYISRLIADPVGRMARAAEEVAMGHVDVDAHHDAKDELGVCAAAFRKLVGCVKEQAEVLERVAAGDYTVSITQRSDKDIINQAINEVIRKSNTMLAEVRGASMQVASGASEISQGAQSLAFGASEQASTVEEFSAALTEVLGQTQKTAENAQQALVATETAGARLDESMEYMKQMLAAMKGIDESSNSVAKVIKVIEDIAFQTNILALNAAVEAARAGQQGKGFAVVADEVRNLASKSAEAARETSMLIDGSLRRVRDGNQIVEDTGASLHATAEQASICLRLMTEIAEASAHQSTSITEIEQGIGQISQVVQANSATAEQSAAASQQMNAQSVVLQEIVSRFKLDESARRPLDIPLPGPVAPAPELKVLRGSRDWSDAMSLDHGGADKY